MTIFFSELTFLAVTNVTDTKTESYSCDDEEMRICLKLDLVQMKVSNENMLFPVIEFMYMYF